ncbi:MAG: hypothetical protein HYR97_08670 [Candidatus Melainabacteria bacterium]|nr:hypothetical protein [Candidatus Melainabacteria bacterium]MBI3309457.1 hypothetical protein [Candidatus Melainabacteria bacterium]
MKQFKPLRFIVFFASVFALAKFFEAGKLMSNELTFANFPLSILSFLGLICLLVIMGYWVYEDEKEKGNLRVKIGFYEKVYSLLTRNSQEQKRQK